MKVRILLLSLLLSNFASYSTAQSVYPGQHRGKITLPLQVQCRAYSFDLKDVRLLSSPFRDNMERESAWILSIGTDRLLHSFRTSAGVYAGREGGYMTVDKLGGWESLDCELRGHSTGHILSGLAYLYASTGDERYKAKADSLVTGLAEVQQTLFEDGHNGYIGAYPENLIERNLAGEPVWAPWYTLHKIYAGLIDQYLYCDNPQALDIITGAAAWATEKLMPLTPEQRRTMLRNEFGGVNEAFYNLYSITGDPEHKALAEFFYHAEVIDPLAEREDVLPFRHANTFIPKVIGEARNFELSGRERYAEIARFFWNSVVDHQTYCTGGNSHKEKFIPADSISAYLTGYTQESCNTNNMLKLTRHLFCWDADPKYADYYERALYNQILGQQDPQSGMVAYFLPLLPGAHKVYSTPEDSFWCCVGTGFENHAKYGESIYFHNDDDLYVNLFIPSELNWKEKGVRICQQTRFPEDGRVTLTVTAEKRLRMAIRLRYPYWATGADVKVNGRKIQSTAQPSGYITINRQWKTGDRIEVDFPMTLHLARANDNPLIAAVMYGPLVLAGAMGTEGMVSPAPFSNPELYNDYYTYDYRIPENIRTSLPIDGNELNKYIRPVDGNPLSFTADDGAVRLEPLYRIHRERYVVYWNIVN